MEGPLTLAGGAPLLAVALSAEGIAELDTAMREDLKALAAGAVDVTLVAERWARTSRSCASYGLRTGSHGGYIRAAAAIIRAKVRNRYACLPLYLSPRYGLYSSCWTRRGNCGVSRRPASISSWHWKRCWRAAGTPWRHDIIFWERQALRSPSNKPGLLTLTIKDKSALYLAYMPFVKNGGLFIPTNSNYRLGDEVFMLLNLMGEEEKLPVAGRVIWMTPKGAQGKRTAGIGVQFSEQDRATRRRKSRITWRRPRRRQATHTM